jgi:hypothetical protein
MENPMTDSTTYWVPDACTLPTAERPLRVADFDDLFAATLREIRGHVLGAEKARLVLAGDATLPVRIQELTDAESSCCSFFTFTLTRLEGAPSSAGGETVVALDIEVPTTQTDVLDALARRAGAASRATS